MSYRPRALFILSFALAAILAARPAAAADVPGTGDDAGKTVVYRDAWGVPHIYAPTVEAGLYAQGWAQAEDRPVELLKNFLRALGESAAVDGPAAAAFDSVSRMWDHYGTGKRNADRIRPDVRNHIRAFARGIHDYYAAHPEDVPEWWGDREIDEYMIIAFGRLFLYAWSIEQAFSDLKRGGIEPGAGEYHHGSNEWAVAPSRSAEGAAILLIDPHLSWWGLSRFWEFRIHAGDLRGSGVTLAGFPYIGLGHTEHLAWAMTTGGPDTADVYILTLNPENPSQYRYDGAWRQMTKRKATIVIRGAEPRQMTIWDSHYGPVIAMRDGKAYAAKTAYADSVQVSEAWHEFNFGTDYRGAVAGMATLHLFPQNVMVADTSGNIYYQRTGRVPRRPAGYDWSRPVDGSTPATEWQGFHPATDHVQMLNPPQGYMQNCNIPADAMVPDSPLTPDKYPGYIYSDAIYGPRTGWTNQRGARAVELLAADDAVTAGEARAYALDVHPYGVARWQAALMQADTQFGDTHNGSPTYRRAVTELLVWDGGLRRDSAAALKYYYWRQRVAEVAGPKDAAALRGIIDFHLKSVGRVRTAQALNDAQYELLAGAVVPAMARLKAEHGSLDAVYGDMFRVGRDSVSWPVGGGGGEHLGMRTLRSVGYGKARPDHTRWGRAGQTSTQVVVLSTPVRSWTYVPIGQSDRPDSPHYRDQAERLFSPRALKPSLWRPEELAGNTASRTVLEDAATK